MDVLLVLGPDLVADRDLLIALAESTAADLGAGLRVGPDSDPSAVPGSGHRASGSPEAAGGDSEVAGVTAAMLAAHDGPAVVVPADPALMAASPSVIGYDLTVASAPAGPAHLHGRGVWGLAWAIRHAVHRFRHPAERVAYGDHPEQWADERPTGAQELPAGAGAAPAPAPVGILVHGGFWRSIWAADLMDALAIDLADRGWTSWNLEYRRPDRHGWAATTADVAAGVAAARERHPGAPIVLFGHSAGGQLALRLAADDPGLALAVSLAGVLDLAEGQRRFLGEGAITTALGGAPAEVPDVYAASDPMTRLPLRSPALLVQGGGDSLDLIDINRRFARASGVTLLELPGDHFDVIDPGSAIWAATMTEVDRLISRT